jgi:hypothetical protein
LRIESRPAFPPASASLRRAKQKNFLYIFLIARPQNFFQLRKRKFFCFDIPLLAERRKRSHPNRAFGAESASGQKFLPPDPLPFCPLASTPAGRARRLQNKGWRVGLANRYFSNIIGKNQNFLSLPCFKSAVIYCKFIFLEFIVKILNIGNIVIRHNPF